ncbi:MAG: dihydrolipoamide acetyltransferase component of pyruvate dehydrogenase complex [Nitrospira sp.]
MATDILMPQLGESIAEGTVVKWLVPPGGAVERDQPLLVVETEKVALDIPSPGTGFLTEIVVQEGETVPVGTLLAKLEDQPRTGVVNRVGGVVVRPMDAPAGDGPHLSPAVRQLAKEHHVDVASIVGSGEGGRVTKKDVLEYVAARKSDRSAAPVATPAVRPHSQMRKTIAERMVLSRRTAAHVSTFFEVDMTGVVRFKEGRRLTFLPFVTDAVTRAMREVPVVNSTWRDDGLLLHQDIHIGIAVALEEGLLVPVIRHADRKDLTTLAKEVADLAQRARAKKLDPEDVVGGTFTITNHGGMGSLFSTPIINQPQVAILGVGSVQQRAVVINEAIAIRPMCYLSLSFDHRAFDGAAADSFVSKVKANLEQSDWEKR